VDEELDDFNASLDDPVDCRLIIPNNGVFCFSAQDWDSSNSVSPEVQTMLYGPQCPKPPPAPKPKVESLVVKEISRVRKSLRKRGFGNIEKRELRAQLDRAESAFLARRAMQTSFAGVDLFETPSADLIALRAKVALIDGSAEPETEDVFTPISIEDVDKDLKAFALETTFGIPRSVDRVKEVQQRCIAWVKQYREDWTAVKRVQQVSAVVPWVWKKNTVSEHFREQLSSRSAIKQVNSDQSFAKDGLIQKSWFGRVSDAFSVPFYGQKALPPK
jgi:hypothetical protein